jgi:hypothetical protein
MPGDIVFDDFYTENLQVLYNPDFKWYYLPDQNTWEASIFKSADSWESEAPGMCKVKILSTKMNLT